ncbi:hypothetical protein DSECCO2_551600 [anaerobic digester metagenome]
MFQIKPCRILCMFFRWCHYSNFHPEDNSGCGHTPSKHDSQRLEKLCCQWTIRATMSPAPDFHTTETEVGRHHPLPCGFRQYEYCIIPHSEKQHSPAMNLLLPDKENTAALEYCVKPHHCWPTENAWPTLYLDDYRPLYHTTEGKGLKKLNCASSQSDT